MTIDVFVLAVIAFTFVLAGFVKGVIGMGLPTIGVGLLSLVMPPGEAVALMLAPSILTNVWQGLAGPHFASVLRRLWPVFVGLCIGTWLAYAIGAVLLTPEAARQGRIALGWTLTVYAGLGLAKVSIKVSAHAERWLGPIIGTVTGVLSAATGVFMIPAVLYYQAIGLSKDALVQTQGVSYTISTLALAALLLSQSTLRMDNAAMSLLAVLPALLGMAAGQWLLGHMRPEMFRLWFYLGMLALGIHLALIQR